MKVGHDESRLPLVCGVGFGPLGVRSRSVRLHDVADARHHREIRSIDADSLNFDSERDGTVPACLDRPHSSGLAQDCGIRPRKTFRVPRGSPVLGVPLQENRRIDSRVWKERTARAMSSSRQRMMRRLGRVRHQTATVPATQGTTDNCDLSHIRRYGSRRRVAAMWHPSCNFTGHSCIHRR